MVPPNRAPLRGRLRGGLRGRENRTRTEGGVSQKQPGGVSHPPFHCSPSLFGFVVLDRPTRTAPAERGETGATPLFHRWRGSASGGVSHPVSHRVSHPPPAVGEVAPVCMYPCGKGSPARTRAGRRAATSRPMLDRLIRAFLVVGGVSVASAWTWPGAFPEADPWRCSSATTPRMCIAPSSRGTTSRPAWPWSSPGNCSSAHRGSGSPGWASVWGAGPAFRAGRFRLRPTGRRSSSARSITRSEPSRARLPNG